MTLKSFFAINVDVEYLLTDFNISHVIFCENKISSLPWLAVCVSEQTQKPIISHFYPVLFVFCVVWRTIRVRIQYAVMPFSNWHIRLPFICLFNCSPLKNHCHKSHVYFFASFSSFFFSKSIQWSCVLHSTVFNNHALHFTRKTIVKGRTKWENKDEEWHSLLWTNEFINYDDLSNWTMLLPLLNVDVDGDGNGS